MKQKSQTWTQFWWRIIGLLGLDGNVVRLRDDASQPSRDSNRNLLPILSLATAATLSLITYIGEAARTDTEFAAAIVWLLLIVLFFPLAYRASLISVPREERLGLVILAGLSVYFLKVVQNLQGILQFDEYLHWVTSIDILRYEHLFFPNPLLPISAVYPGLEIVTTAVAHLSGLPVGTSGIVVIATARLIMVVAVFLLFERVSGSSRVGTIASFAFMGNSSFAWFHSQFAYESLAFPMLLVVLLISAIVNVRRDPEFCQSARGLMVSSLILIAAITMTHHLTAGLLWVFLTGLTVLEWNPFSGPASASFVRTPGWRAYALLAALTASLALVWAWLVNSDLVRYVGPMIDDAMHTVSRIFTGRRWESEVSAAPNITQQPLMLQLLAIVNILLIGSGLLYGFFRTLSLEREASFGLNLCRPFTWFTYSSSMVALLVVLAAMFPLTVLLRLNPNSWEVGMRLGAFSFIGVALVFTVGLLSLEKLWRNVQRGAAISAALLTILFLGGVAAGAALQIVPSPYRAAGDNHAVEKTGIEAAQWAREWLGCDNRFAADRVNRLLLATYGCQTPVTTLFDHVDTSWLTYSEVMTDEDYATIRDGDLDFLLFDMRLTIELPFLGVYYEKGEAEEIHEAPMDPRVLDKFTAANGIGCVFDNGIISIFDLRNSRDSR